MATNKKTYLGAVRKKLHDPKTKQLLQFGQLSRTNAVKIRDEEGYMGTAHTILTSSANNFDLSRGKVALAHMMQNFSEGTTYSDVADVKTVGAVDLTILAMSQSLIPFVCVDRGMPNPEYVVYFTDLVASNTAGGVVAGGAVAENFRPINPNIRLGGVKTITLSGTTLTGTTLEKVMPKRVKVDIYGADGKIAATGQDFTGDGTIYFGDVVTGGYTASGITAASVVYATGAVTLTGTFATDYKAMVTVQADTVAAGQVLQVEPKWTPMQLTAHPNFINLQNNLQNMAYMQKTYTIASGSATNPYNEVLFQRVKNTYIESINALVIQQLIQSKPVADISFDLDGYGVDHFAATKNDLVAQVVSNMKAQMVGQTNLHLTGLVVNTNAAALLEQVPVHFVALPASNMGVNGLVGYMMGIPVYRHNSLDAQNNSDAIMFGVHRSADNICGAQVYGEYLPFTSTDTVSNFQQPTQYSQGFYSQVGSKIVNPNLVVRADIRPPASIFSKVNVNYATDYLPTHDWT